MRCCYSIKCSLALHICGLCVFVIWALGLSASRLHVLAIDSARFFFPFLPNPLPCSRPMDEQILERFNEFVKRRSLRRTTQRDSIVRSIFAKDEHFTSEELFERIRRTDKRASRATVYRTIRLLVEAGLLREIDIGGEEKTYDPNFLDKPSHNHLVCIDCGKVVEFEDLNIDLLNDCVTRRLGFRPMRQSILRLLIWECIFSLAPHLQICIYDLCKVNCVPLPTNQWIHTL